MLRKFAKTIFCSACSSALTVGSLGLFLTISSLCANAQKLQPNRAVLYKVGAKYPPSLRMNGIGGTVRLELLIDAHGTVQKVTPVGGNPALIDSATAAVKQWKYAPADAPTKMQIQFAFVPDQK